MTKTITIPAGTQMYVTKKFFRTVSNTGRKQVCCPPQPCLNIQPGQTLLNDSLYVAYDVKVGNRIVIPRGTRVTGNWVTETTPTIAAQLQITNIFLFGSGQAVESNDPIRATASSTSSASADSEVFGTIACYNNFESEGAPHHRKKMAYRSGANLDRRIIRVNCQTKTLLDQDINTAYLQIPTDEILVTFNQDFTIENCNL